MAGHISTEAVPSAFCLDGVAAVQHAQRIIGRHNDIDVGDKTMFLMGMVALSQ
jgi:hypothetical protein